MESEKYIGHVDKFMTPEDALKELTTGKSIRYIYGEFAIRDILIEACVFDWNYLLEDGINMVHHLIDNIIRLPNYQKIKDSKEYQEYESRKSSTSHEDRLKCVEFINDIFDEMRIPYHFYVYQEDGVDKIRVKRDGGIV